VHVATLVRHDVGERGDVSAAEVTEQLFDRNLFSELRRVVLNLGDIRKWIVHCISSSDCSGGVVSVLLGNGDGTLQPAQTYSSGGTGGIGIALRDINGDGLLDIVALNACASGTDCFNFATTLTSSVGMLIGNGDGSFQATRSFDTSGILPSSMVIGDVNGDGKVDIVVAGSCSSSAALPACAQSGTSNVAGVLLQ
jgi:hypothetical protein